jgi:protein-disulfide isomerase
MNSYLRAMYLGVVLAAVCAAQTIPRSEVDQRIEHQVRSYAGAKATAKITLGERKQSEFAGFEVLPVTIEQDGTKKTFEFQVSKDGSRLLYINSFDLSEDPYARAMKSIDLKGRPARGASDPKVTIVVYDDFQCPFCAKFYVTLFNEVMNNYRDNVRVVFKDFPLADAHPWATHAAIDGNCLAAQSNDAYWSFADFVHTHQQHLNEDHKLGEAPDKAFLDLDDLAKQVATSKKLDDTTIAQCIAAQKTDQIDSSIAEGTKLGVSATPGIFVNGEQLEGALTTTEIKAAIEQALARSQKETKR